MGSLEKSPQRVGFGEFVLDLRTRELFANGDKLDLQEQPFLVLSTLLEKPGELVSREELTERLWPAGTFVDFEHALNRVINRLREALHDSAENPRFIQTLPRRGYRFITTVRPVMRSDPNGSSASVDPTVADLLENNAKNDDEEAVADVGRRVGTQNGQTVNGVSAQTAEEQRSSLLRRLPVFASAIGLGCLAGIFSYWLLSPAHVSHVIRTRQLTTGANIDNWAPVVTDGSRVLYLEREGDHWSEKQISVSGGEPQLLAVPFHNTVILDISPDRSNYLVANFEHREDLMPLWIWPVQGGAPRRIGNLLGYKAAWCPDGHSIVYSARDGIYRAEIDGANPRKLVATEGGYAADFNWSPDGRYLRYTVFTQSNDATIWQVEADGSHLQRVPSSWGKDAYKECCGHWGTNGEYYIFSSAHLRSGDIWAVREKKSLWQRAVIEPVRLTALPIYFGESVPINDHTLLAVGVTQGLATHVSFDPVRHQFSPVLPSLSAWTLSYSADGKWVTYVSTSENTLMRARADGSDPRVLAQLKYQANRPYWSPDGKQILFDGETSDGIQGVFLISSDTGPPKQLLPRARSEPAWSPNGRLISYNEVDDSVEPPRPASSIHLLDLTTGRSQRLRGSEGLRDANWSPDGRYIAAADENQQKLMLLDTRSGTWSQIATAKLLTERFWSKDSKFLYYEDLLSPNQPIYRIRISDRKLELIGTFENYLHSGFQRAALIAVAPDGSLICRLDPASTNIYALDVEMQ